MKNFIKIAGVIAMVAVIGLSFIGCFGSGGSGGGNSGGSRSSGTASVVPASDFKYELSADGTGVKLLEYTGPGGNIIFPTEIEGLPIVDVGEGIPFSGGGIEFTNIISAVIPDYYLPMWQEEYENEYDKGYGIFRIPFEFDERLESVTFPKGIKYIPSQFFQNCKGLKSYTIPDTVTEIHDGAFYGSGLTSIVIPEGVTFIGDGAFGNCVDLKSVTLPESIREIRGSVFRDCSNLETVNIPSHQIDIESYPLRGAFEGCTKLSLTTQQAIRAAGYTGSFN